MLFTFTLMPDRERERDGNLVSHSTRNAANGKGTERRLPKLSTIYINYIYIINL